MSKKNSRREIIKGGMAALGGLLIPIKKETLAGSLPQIELNSRDKEIIYFWTGGLTATSIRINLRLNKAGIVQILYQDNDNLQKISDEVEIADSNNPDLVHTVELTGLTAGTSYRFWVLIDGVFLSSQGSFSTPNAGIFSFKIAFGNCCATGSESDVFKAILNQNPLLFMQLGDLHYENIAKNDPKLFREAYRRVLTSSTQSALYQKVPVVYVWDDHDYGGNNTNKNSVSAPAAQSMYRMCVPHYPLENGSGGINHSFEIGRVKFVVTDGRSERVVEDGNGKERSLLGRSQIDWFKREVLKAKESHLLTVWLNNVPWISNTDVDTWAGFEAERREIANFIESNDIDNIVMLAGDAHILAFDNGENNRYGDRRAKLFPVFHAGPLDSNPVMRGGPYTSLASLENGNFGIMEVFDFGNKIDVVWRGHRVSEGRDAVENVTFSQEEFKQTFSFPAPEHLMVESMRSTFLPVVRN